MLMQRSWKYNFQSLWHAVTCSGFKHKSSHSVYNAVRVNGSAHQMDCNVSYICQLTWDRTFSINIIKCQLPTKNRLPVSVGVCGSTFAVWIWLFWKKGVGVNLLMWFSICIAVTVRSQGCGCRNEGRKKWWDMCWYNGTGVGQPHRSVLNDSRCEILNNDRPNTYFDIKWDPTHVQYRISVIFLCTKTHQSRCHSLPSLSSGSSTSDCCSLIWIVWGSISLHWKKWIRI